MQNKYHSCLLSEWKEIDGGAMSISFESKWTKVCFLTWEEMVQTTFITKLKERRIHTLRIMK